MASSFLEDTAIGLSVQLEFLLDLFPVPEVCPHEGLPQPAVVRNGKVKKLVNDHIIPECGIQAEQIKAEVEVAIG